MKAVLLLIAASFALAGCASVPVTLPRTVIASECTEKVPSRSAWPTDNLSVDASLDQFVQAAQAELALREGYETELLTALIACTTPLDQRPK